MAGSEAAKRKAGKEGAGEVPQIELTVWLHDRSYEVKMLIPVKDDDAIGTACRIIQLLWEKYGGLTPMPEVHSPPR